MKYQSCIDAFIRAGFLVREIVIDEYIISHCTLCKRVHRGSRELCWLAMRSMLHSEFRIKRDSGSGNERALCLASKANSGHRSVSPATSRICCGLTNNSPKRTHSCGLVICLDLTDLRMLRADVRVYKASQIPRILLHLPVPRSIRSRFFSRRKTDESFSNFPIFDFKYFCN